MPPLQNKTKNFTDFFCFCFFFYNMFNKAIIISYLWHKKHHKKRTEKSFNELKILCMMFLFPNIISRLMLHSQNSCNICCVWFIRNKPIGIVLLKIEISMILIQIIEFFCTLKTFRAQGTGPRSPCDCQVLHKRTLIK